MPNFINITAAQSFSESITATLPAGAQAGDLLFAEFVVASGNPGTLGVPAGWTVEQNDTADAFRSAHWLAYAIYDGTSSYQFTMTPVKGTRLVISAWRDVNQSTPVQISGKSTQYPNAASIASQVLAVANANSLEYLSVTDLDGASRTFTNPSGFTEILNRNTYPSMIIATRAAAPSQTTAATVNVTPNAKMSLFNVVINPAPSGPAPFTLDVEPATESSAGSDMNFTWPVSGFTLDMDAANEPSAGADMEFITGQGTVVSGPLYLNTDQPTGLLANTLLTYVALYDVDTGELVARFPNVTTDADGRYTITSHLITTGVSYRHDWQNSVNGASKMPVSVAA